ncbi:MAG: SCO family protein [Desulfobacula sp.]|nr:SCO family protein [Desulfobacula sp.]
MMKLVSVLLICFLLVLGMPPAGSAADNSAADHKDHASESMGSDAADPGVQKPMAMEHDHSQMVMDAQKEEPVLADQVKLEERLGEVIDFSASFVDENNRPVDLKTIFDKPVLLLPVYFMCTSVCNFLQAELANVLNLVGQIPGTDFNIITVSFADDEDASHAKTSKRNYANLLKREFPMENWVYLTSDNENIRKLTDSLGYYFIKKKDHFYIHPSAMVVLAKDGKIIRYLYGPSFLPFDVGMALSEAQKGDPGISIKRGVLSFCFDCDPENKTYVFKMFRITGTAILILLVGFVLFLIYPSKKSRKRRL